MGSDTYTVHMVSTIHYSLKAVSLKRIPLWERWTGHSSKDKGRGKKPLGARIQLAGQLAVVSPQWLPVILSFILYDTFLSYYFKEKPRNVFLLEIFSYSAFWLLLLFCLLVVHRNTMPLSHLIKYQFLLFPETLSLPNFACLSQKYFWSCFV